MTDAPLTIDAHQHFWELGRFDYSWLSAPGKEKINRSYLPADLQPHLDATGIRGSVFVQTRHNTAENDWILSLADQHDSLLGVVGWVDLASPAVAESIKQYKPHPHFVGVRHNVQDEPDDNFILRPEIIRGLQSLESHSVPFDLLFYEKHTRHASTVARQVPNLPLVINHLSKPAIASGSLDAWEPHFRAAAECDNVFCKLSGMVTEADHDNWTVDDLRPYVDVALECFGPERLMFGSDWPVCELASSYEEVHSALRELISELSDAEQARILSGTAIEFYGLTVPDKP